MGAMENENKDVQAMLDFYEKGFDGKPLDPVLKPYIKGVDEDYTAMYGKDFTGEKDYEPYIKSLYEESIRDCLEIHLKRMDILAHEPFNIQAEWKNTLGDNWECNAMAEIINREFKDYALALCEGSRMRISVYTDAPEWQQEIVQCVKKSWGNKSWNILPFMDVEKINKFSLELENGQTVTGYVNAPTNKAREQMNEYAVCLERGHWRTLRNEKGGNYSRFHTWEKIDFPRGGEVGIRSYTPIEKMEADRVEKMKIYRVERSGKRECLVTCKAEGRQMEEWMSRVDVRRYEELLQVCTRAEREELDRHYVNKYFAGELENNREQGRGFKR